MSGGQNFTSTAPKAASVRVMTSAYGRVVPLVFGKARVQANTIYYTDFRAIEHKSTQSAGGKGGGGGTQTTIDYTYTVCIVLALSEGVSPAVGTIWCGKKKGAAADFGLTYLTGSDTQNPFGYISTAHPSEALAYRGTSYLAAAAFDLGSDPSTPNINAEVSGRLLASGAGLVTTGDVNPAAIINELVTDSGACLGMPASVLGSLSAMSTYAQAAKLLVSPAYTEAKPAREMIQSLCTVANTGVYFSEGKAKFVPYGDGAITDNGTTYTPSLTPTYEITEDDLLPNGDEPAKLKRKPQADAYNHVRVKFSNRAIEYNDDIAEAKDQASIEANGLRTMAEVSMPEITEASVARRVAQNILQRASNIRNRYEFRVGWRFARLEPMDIVNLTESGLGLVAEPLRVVEVEEDDDGTLTILAEEMQIGSLGPANYPSQTSNGYKVDYNVPAGNTNAPVVFEPPASAADGLAQIWIAASGGDDWGGCEVWISDDNATYAQVGRITGKARHGILTAVTPTGPALDTASTVKVDMSISAAELQGGTTQNATDLTTLCFMDGELFAYRDATLTGPNAYTLAHLVRGAYGSPISSHAIGSKFARLDQSVFRYTYEPKFVGRNIYIKLRSFNVYGSGLQDLAAISPTVYAIVGAPIEGVSGLALEQPFTGTSCKVKWTATPGAVDYTVEVRNSAGSVLYRTVKTPDLRFEYTWEDSKADGGPYRSLQIRVRANSVNGSSSAFAALPVSNPVPAALGGLNVTGGYGAGFFDCTLPTEEDYAGVRIWISTSSGFTPSDANLLYDGQAPSLAFRQLPDGNPLAAGATYYLRAAAYDVFGKTSLNLSSELSITTLTIAAGIGPGEITATLIANGAIDMAKHAAGIRPPRVVTSLPAIDGTTYKNGDTVTLTTDGKLYRAFAGSWTKATDGADIVANSITAAQIAAGSIGATQIAANAITADKLFVGVRGAALNDAPSFEDLTAWVLGSGISRLSNAAGSAVAPTYLIATAGQDMLAFSLRFFPIDPSKVYSLTAMAYAEVGNNRNMYLWIDFYDSAGNVIGGTGWGGARSGYVYGGQPAPSDWRRVGAQFGPGTGRAIPANVKQCRIGVWFQYSGSGSSQVPQAWQDVRLEEAVAGTLIRDGAITTDKVAANAINAGKIAANTITAAQIAANTITGDRLAVATITADRIAAGTLTATQVSVGAGILNTEQQWTQVQNRPTDDSIKNNLIDLSSWRKGAAIPWTPNGEANAFFPCAPGGTADLPIGLAGPRGGNDVVWYCQEQANNGQQGGGWDAPAMQLDPTKIYRFAVPIRIYGPAATAGTAYWGTGGVCDLNTTTANSNPYFAVLSRPQMQTDRWYLFVGYVFPYGSTANTHDSAGIWDCKTGVKVGGGSNYNHSSSGIVNHRAYQYYAENGAQQLFGRPMINLVDGTEPSLREYFEQTAVLNQSAYDKFDTVGVNISGAGVQVRSVATGAIFFDASASSPPWVVSLASTGTGSGTEVSLAGATSSSNTASLKSLKEGDGIDLSDAGSAVIISARASEVYNAGRSSDSTLTTTYVNPTGFSYSLEANCSYYFEAVLAITTANTDYATHVAMNLASGQTGYFHGEMVTSVNGMYSDVQTVVGNGTDQGIFLPATIATAAEALIYTIRGIINTTAAGLLKMMLKADASTNTLKAGSMMRLSKLTKPPAASTTIEASPWGTATEYSKDGLSFGNSVSATCTLTVKANGRIFANGLNVGTGWAVGDPLAEPATDCEVQFVAGSISTSANSSGSLSNGAAAYSTLSGDKSISLQVSTSSPNQDAFGSGSVSVTINIRKIGTTSPTSRTLTLTVFNTVNFNNN